MLKLFYLIEGAFSFLYPFFQNWALNPQNSEIKFIEFIRHVKIFNYF